MTRLKSIKPKKTLFLKSKTLKRINFGIINLKKNDLIVMYLTKVSTLGESRKYQNFMGSNVFFGKFTPLFLSFYKELIFMKSNLRRQSFFFIKELIQSLFKSNFLIKKEILLLNLGFLNHFKNYMSFYSNYLKGIFLRRKVFILVFSTKFFLNLILLKFFVKALVFLTLIFFTKNFINKDPSLILRKNAIVFFKFSLFEIKFWIQKKNPNILINSRSLCELEYLERLNKKQKVLGFIQKQSFKYFDFKSFSLGKKNISNRNFVWKHASFFGKNALKESIIKIGSLFNKRFKDSRRDSSLQLIYIFSLLEDKILFLKQKGLCILKLSKLQNLILFLLKEKKERNSIKFQLIIQKTFFSKLQKNIWHLNFFKNLVRKKSGFLQESKLKRLKKQILLRILSIKKTKNRNLNVKKTVAWKFFDSFVFNSKKKKFDIFKFLSKRQLVVKQKLSKNKKFYGKRLRFKSKFKKNFKKKLISKKRISLIITKKNVIKRKLAMTFKLKNRTRFLKQKVVFKRTWIGKRVVLSGKHLNFLQKKLILSSWISKSVNLFFINALSLTKFSYKKERKISKKSKKNFRVNKYLSFFDRFFINRYKYIGIYIKDFVRIAFISIFFKKPSFLAKFVAFQLAKLPRNRKETSFIRFLIKVIRIFSAARSESLGVRIKFKGRVNRWRRTKFILGNRGDFPLGTISERIEQGTAQAINRKGAVGIRIWLRYESYYTPILKKHIINYIRYSQRLKAKTLRKITLLK